MPRTNGENFSGYDSSSARCWGQNRISDGAVSDAIRTWLSAVLYGYYNIPDINWSRSREGCTEYKAPTVIEMFRISSPRHIVGKIS
ncbi:MAG: hypothetical protein U9N36_01490 [Euryarchaeota archaeon]|nr:hypothetical protein [Euryarchaeota archaeon]